MSNPTDEPDELTRLQKENAELLQEKQERNAKDAFIAAATKAGARSPELLWRSTKGDLKFNDKGEVENLQDLVSGLKTDFADQFGEPKPEKTIDGGAGGDTAPAKLTKEKLEKMSQTEISKLPWDDVKAAMSES